MNVYDFDGTIYDGDSSIDFFVFCVKRNWQTLRMLPTFGLSAALYVAKIRTKEQLKTAYFSFVQYLDDVDETVVQFWESHSSKIKLFYIKKHQSTDIIISASPEFLLKPICEKLDSRLIATIVDPKAGELNTKNCHGPEKVRRLQEYTTEQIQEFYSDSRSDQPLAELAETAFLVSKDKVTPW